MAPNLNPGQTLGGYRIEAVAGRGGMGVVYRAVQMALDRTVALKLVAPELASDDSFRERFERESKVLASIDHPNVIPVFEAGEASGQLFISMRWVEGTDLSRLLAGPALEPARAVNLIRKVAGALDAAHARGLVHRDVKPGNVLIESGDGPERVFLTDFGLSKRIGSGASLTGTGQWVGTLDYVAPEQIEGRAVDARIDVYALGCVLYQTLTGSVPFERDSEAAKLWAHMSEAPPAATAERADLPPDLDAVIARAMAKDPEERYPSAGDLGRAAAAAAGQATPPAPERSVAVGPAAPTAAAGPAPPAAPDAEPPTQPVAAGRTPQPRRTRRRVLAIGGACIVLVGAVIGALALTGEDDGKPASSKTAGKDAPARPSAPAVEVDRVRLGRRVGPGAVAADSSGAYVVDQLNGELIKVDGDSMQVAGRIKVGKEPRNLAIDPANQRLWLAVRSNDSLVGLDLLRGQLVCRLRGSQARPPARRRAGQRAKPECPRVQDQPNFVAVPAGGDVVTLSSRRDGAAFARVNPKTLKRVGKPKEVGGATADLVSGTPGFLGLFALSPTVVPYSRDLKPSGKAIKIPTDSITSVPLELTVGADQIVAWVTLTGEDPEDKGTVVRVDLIRSKPIGKPIPVGRVPAGIGIGDGIVWVANIEDGTVTRIDEESGRVIDEIDIGRNAGKIAVDGNVVWVSGEKDLVRIRPKR